MTSRNIPPREPTSFQNLKRFCRHLLLTQLPDGHSTYSTHTRSNRESTKHPVSTTCEPSSRAQQHALLLHPLVVLLFADSMTLLARFLLAWLFAVVAVLPHESCAMLMTSRLDGISALATISNGTYPHTVLNTSIPKPLSDHTASLLQSSATNAVIFLAGGCDAPDGNVYDNATDSFVCNSISSSVYSFTITPTGGVWDQWPSMPTARYRHAAVAISNHLWVVGGRDLQDNVIATVNVRI